MISGDAQRAFDNPISAMEAAILNLFRGLRSGPGTVCRHAFAIGVLAALLLASSSANAQNRLNVWTADDGLPQNIIRGMHQTPDGYLWIATLDGLARFGGTHFKVFNKGNSPGITTNRFDSMIGGRNGDLWMVTESGGITRYHDGSFQTYGEGQGLPESKPVVGITSDDSGQVWISFTDTIALWDEASGRFHEIPRVPRVHIYKSLRWGHRGFWGWNDEGLHCFVKGKFIDVPLPPWLPGSSIWQVLLDQKGNIWLETFTGKHVRISAGEASVQPPGSTVDYIDRQGNNWKMRGRYQLDRSMEGTTFGANPPGPFTHVIEDREGSLWLGD